MRVICESDDTSLLISKEKDRAFIERNSFGFFVENPPEFCSITFVPKTFSQALGTADRVSMSGGCLLSDLT
jgi:hypothetical protein